MQKNEIEKLVEAQYDFFNSQQTKNVSFRKKALKQLRQALIDNEKALMEALWADLHKSNFETFSNELAQVLNQIDLQIRKINQWSKTARRRTPLALFPSRSRIYKEPYGNVLIISPWNYPLLLLIDPLVGAISAGNTVVLKPSPYLENFGTYLDKLIGEIFPPEYIAVVHGNRQTNKLLLAQKWDYIFFTGSPALGKIVMKAAAENLTPFTLELGGKSPCIVDEDANLKLAARRIVWGKFINAGQTCIAPDYLLVHQKVKAELIAELKKAIHASYGDDPKNSPDYCRIVNQNAFNRLSEFLAEAVIVEGGITDANEKYIAPTIIDEVEADFPIMQEEIFGPLLPVMTFSQLDKAVDYVNSCEKPLAFYYFSNNLKKAQSVLQQTTSGGGCINDTVIHIANGRLPFGGVGNSGMGKYHGRWSFDTFTNLRSIVYSSRWIDIPIKYPPYAEGKLKLVKRLL